MRFETLPDFWYRDAKTGLEWSPELGPCDHADSVDMCINVGGRLPTIEEWLTVVDYAYSNPATRLPGMQSNFYWSSTSFSANPGGAWVVGFYNGYTYDGNKTSTYCVRAVRGAMKP